MSIKLPQAADLSSIFDQHIQYLMILTSNRGAALTQDRTRSGGVNQIGLNYFFAGALRAFTSDSFAAVRASIFTDRPATVVVR